MSLPTSGMSNADQSAASNMFTQASQAVAGMQPALSMMNMAGMPSLHPHHPFMLGSQPGMISMPGSMATAAEVMVNACTTVNSRLGQLGAEQPTLRFPGGSMHENGHGLSMGMPHSVAEGMPYGNITVKQEVGVPAGMSMASQRTSSLPQRSQLSSPDAQSMGPMSNSFSVGKNIPVSKHICAVCGDRASGKHYGVYSCEGCKGFFKRTVRKYLTYTCRDDKDCVIDKRQRNRCQYCRYQKCLAMGMKKEAVQEERQKNREQEESTNEVQMFDDMSVDKIYQAEVSTDPKLDNIDLGNHDASVNRAANQQMFMLVRWAKKVPHFTELPMDDQVTLLRAGWNELLIASFSHRSVEITDGILLASGVRVCRQTANSVGVALIFDRVLTELISKMRDMNMDRTELGCLRVIVLYNPDIKDLTDSSFVESLRERVYASLEIYCKTKYPEQPGRFAKLLLRLPALRSIGLKCLEHLFFYKLLGNKKIDDYLVDTLTTDKPMHASNSRPTSASNDFASTSAAAF